MGFITTKYNNGCIITNAVGNKLILDYFTLKAVDYSRGASLAKTITMELFIRQGKNIVVPAGFISYLGQDGIIYDKECTTPCIQDLWDKQCLTISNEEISKCLTGITLRPIQTKLVRSMLCKNRCGVQAATGFGKTLVIGAIFTMINKLYKEQKTGLLLVPTSHLLEETSNRLTTYGLDINRYDKSREIIKGKINIGMATSLCNDINSGSTDLTVIDMVIVDEAHHARAETYFKVVTSCINAIATYGLSGTLFANDLEKYDWTDIHSFSLDESRICGLFGKVEDEITYDQLVDLGYLTDCKVYQIESNIQGKQYKNFSLVAPTVIENEKRLQMMADAIVHCEKELGYQRFMCYVRVREAGERFMRYLAERGVKSLIAFGGKQNAFLNELGEIEYVGKNKLFPKFASGEYGVLIATSALDEGVDVPQCDGIVLLAGGQSIRQVLQRVGRGFRLAEGKKYAIIIDTYDKGNQMTKKHSNTRKKIYKTRLNKNITRVKDINLIK